MKAGVFDSTDTYSAKSHRYDRGEYKGRDQPCGIGEYNWVLSLPFLSHLSSAYRLYRYGLRREKEAATRIIRIGEREKSD